MSKDTILPLPENVDPLTDREYRRIEAHNERVYQRMEREASMQDFMSDKQVAQREAGHPWLRARSITLGGGPNDKGYEYVLLEDAIEYAEAAAGPRDIERLRNMFRGISLPAGPDFAWVDGHRPFIAAALDVIDEWAER